MLGLDVLAQQLGEPQRRVRAPELVERYPTMTARLAHRQEVDRAVAHWVAALAADEALAHLDAAEVPCSRVASVRDIFDDAQVRARGNVETIASPLGGLLHMAGIVPRLTATPGIVRHAGPLAVGEHNEEILHGLGYDAPAIAELRRERVI